MGRIAELYRQSAWHEIYNNSDKEGIARRDILLGNVFANVVAALAEGTFYTGFLLCYGINIVNITVLTAIPYVTGWFSLLTPRLLTRFKKRRTILSVSRMLYYAIRIVGITILPQVIHSDTERIWGLVAIVFLSSSINNLFTSGFSAWHVSYLMRPEIRVPHLGMLKITCAIASQFIPLLFSGWIDSMQGQAKLSAYILLRVCALGAAAVDVYFFKRPPEPEYAESSTHQSLLDVFRIPLGNVCFCWTMAIYAGYVFIIYGAASMSTSWALDTLHASLRYVTTINFLYIPIMLLTWRLWNRIARRLGTFQIMTVVLSAYILIGLIFAFTNSENYLWRFALARIGEQCVYLGVGYSVDSLIYVHLPDEDRTCYLSFYIILGNVASFCGAMLGAWILGMVGDGSVNICGYQFGAFPTACIVHCVLMSLLLILNFAVRKIVRPSPKTE